MPSETIRSRVEIDDGAGPYLNIGWGRDGGYVQLGTVVPEGQGQLQVRGPDGWIETDSVGDVGWYVQLDREGINRAIRTLRRARDVAFGRDE